MAPPPSDEAPNKRTPGPKPLSRRATRLFVVLALLFIVAASIGGSYYLVSVTSTALEAPVDTTGTDTTVADTASTAPDRPR